MNDDRPSTSGIVSDGGVRIRRDRCAFCIVRAPFLRQFHDSFFKKDDDKKLFNHIDDSIVLLLLHFDAKDENLAE